MVVEKIILREKKKKKIVKFDNGEVLVYFRQHTELSRMYMIVRLR